MRRAGRRVRVESSEARSAVLWTSEHRAVPPSRGTVAYSAWGYEITVPRIPSARRILTSSQVGERVHFVRLVSETSSRCHDGPMTSLNRLVIGWQGPQIAGAAVTVLHYSASDNAAPPVGAVMSALTTVRMWFPTGVVWTIPNTGDVIDDKTGALTGVWTASGGGQVSAGGPAQAAAGVGGCIGWTTGGIVPGKRGPRKLRGRTFLVPLCAGNYDSDGTHKPDQLLALQTLANDLQAAGPLAIWHRPSAPGAADGNSYGVIANRVRDKVAFLSSRRD